MKKIGLITGVFDLLHGGHLDFIEKAIKEVDFLVIGLESDERVKLLKGEKRPYHNEEVRRERLQKIFKKEQVIILSDDFGERRKRESFFKRMGIIVLLIAENDKGLENKKKEAIFLGVEVQIVKSRFKISSTQIINKKVLEKYLIYPEDRQFYE